MKVSEKGASAAAIIAALSTLACCLPLGFLGAVGLASLSLWARPIQSVAVARLDCIPMRWFTAAVFQEIVRKAEHCEPRALLDCGGYRDSGGPVSSTGRHPHCQLEGIVSYAEEQRVMGTSWAGRVGRCLVLFVCDYAEGSAAAHAPNER